MDYVILNDGTRVPSLGMGTWYLGEGRRSAAQEERALRAGIEAGVTLIDTAEMYGDGAAEELVGRAIRGYDRDELFLVSKVYPHNAGRRNIFRACEDSLRRMEEQTGAAYDYLMDLDITSPLRTAADIENAFAKKQSRTDLDLVFSVCEARRNPWFNMVKTVDDHVEQVNKSEFTGRQQAPEVYDVNASIYVFKRDFLAHNTDGMLWRGKIGVSVMMDTGIIDIDSEHDYRLMEAIAAHLYANYPDFDAVRRNIRS